MKLRNELVEQINIFNKIFELDFINAQDDEKSWKYYLDKISKNLFDESYITFMKNNLLVANTTPGTFEKYYNLFQKIVHDFKSISFLEVPKQIYGSAKDIINLFNEFLLINNFKVEEKVDPNSNLNYKIYPII